MRRTSYPEFRRRVSQAAGRARRPLRVMFELTYGCDFRCGHCYVPGPCRSRYAGRELDTGQVLDILSQLKEAGCLYLGFTGGEPLMRPDLPAILKAARREGFITTLCTNGHRLDASMAALLGRLGVAKVDVTLPAFTESAFRAVTGAAGGRDRVFEALAFLERSGVAYSLKTCVMAANRSEVGMLGRFAADKGVLLRVSDEVLPAWNEGNSPSKPGQGAGQGPVKGLGRTCRVCPVLSGRGAAGAEALFCGAGATQAAITPAGELKPCLLVTRPRAGILERGFEAAWAGLDRFWEDKAWT